MAERKEEEARDRIREDEPVVLELSVQVSNIVLKRSRKQESTGHAYSFRCFAASMMLSQFV